MKARWFAACVLAVLPAAGQPHPGVWAEYHDYAAMRRALAELAQAYPDLVCVESLGHSVQGREIWLATIGHGARHGHAAVLVDGAMHGSEAIGAESALAYARYLAGQYGRDARATRIVDEVQTYVIPMVNPDGVEAAKTARSWKDARKNAHGVNLNRNFDWNWETAGVDDPLKEDYRGPYAFSEPESRIVRGFVRGHALALYVNGHAGEDREPHLVTPLHSRDGARYERIAETVEASSGFTRARGALAGGGFNWAYWLGMPHAGGARPLAVALEIYSDPDISPSSTDWWARYNPSGKELAEYLVRVREALLRMTEEAVCDAGQGR